MNVLFVCIGNVARSQTAETMFNHLSVHHATSAGMAVQHLDWEGQTIKALSETGETARNILELMMEKGFDLSNNVLKQVTPEIVEAADRVILMEGRIPPEDFLAQSDKLQVWDIADPARASRESTEKILDEVTQRVQRLVEELG